MGNRLVMVNRPRFRFSSGDAFQAPRILHGTDIGAIFGAYARLYPGMKSRLDISDQPTVVGSVSAVLGHMNLPITIRLTCR